MLDKRIKLMNNIFRITIILWILLLIPINMVSEDNISMQHLMESLMEIMPMVAFLSMGASKLYKNIDNTSESVQKADNYCKISSIGAVIIICILFVFISIDVSIKIALVFLYIIVILIWEKMLEKSLKNKA